MKVINRTLMVLFLGLVVVACGAAGSGNGEGESPEEDGTTTAPSPSETTVPEHPDPDRVPTTTLPAMTGEVPDEILDAILDDAADRAGLAPEDLEVVRDQAMEWPDGSLGCPEPGEFYTQAIVSGYWVEIEAPDAKYDYRVDGRGNFNLCESGLFPPSRGGSTTPTTTGSDS